MGGPEIALLAAGGLSGLGSIFAPEGQELASFEGDQQLDPRTQAAQIRQGMGDYLGLALNEARKPVELTTTVAPLPSFTGGGLPMNISAPAMDPARRAPSRRTFAPPDIPSDFAGAILDPAQRIPPPSGGGDHPPIANPPPWGNGPTRDPNPTGRRDVDNDSLSQARGAIDLLMQQFQDQGVF